MEKWNNIERKKIKWFPAIDYKKCVGCLACVNKCTHGVYVVKDNKPKVVKKENCVVGCRGCESVCPIGAITHPSDEYLENLLKDKNKTKEKKEKCSCGCDKICKC